MIRVERAEGVAEIVIDRPAARNALTFAMWNELRERAHELDADPSVRVVIVRGHGGAFVSGTDIAEFRGFTAADGVAYEGRTEAALQALEAIRVPTIAAIRGACTGGGVAIAAACDLRIGGPGARIGVPIARTLGNCLAVANVARVANLIGIDAVKAMIFGADLLDGAAAHRAGFLTSVAAADEQVDDEARRTAHRLLALAPLTLQATKTMCRRLRDARALPPDDDLLQLCYGSADFAEGVTAFLDKRSPHWTGR